MLAQLKGFLRHSIVYSISNAAAKAMGVILLPLYTTFLSLADFGQLAIVEVTLVIAVELFALGQGPSIVMFNDTSEYKEGIKSIYFTVYSFSLAVALGAVMLGWSVLDLVAWFSLPLGMFESHYWVIAGIFVSRIIHGLCLDKIRAEEKSVLYTSLNLMRLLITLLVTIYFVAYEGYGVAGVLYGYLAGDGFTAIYTSIHQVRSMTPVFRKDILPASVRFGIPLIFTSVAFMILNVSDRYIIGYYRGSEEVALYDLGYRVAGVINMFIIMPFTLTLLPSAYKMYGKEGDKRYYSKLLTYFTFILVWAGLALSLYAEELIQLFALNKDYWPSYKVVPLVILGYIFSGMRLVAVLGQFLTRNLKSLIPLTLSAAFMNVTLNFVFIPLYGMIAAAYTTLLSFLFLYLLSLQISDKYYHIQFEHKKTLNLILLGSLFYLPFVFWSLESVLLNLSVKLLVIIAFPLVLLPLKFYEEAELQVIKKVLRSPAAGLKELIKK